jgi:hypothetical protein
MEREINSWLTGYTVSVRAVRVPPWTDAAGMSSESSSPGPAAGILAGV